MATYPTPPNQSKRKPKRTMSESSAGQRKRTPIGPRGKKSKDSAIGKSVGSAGPKLPFGGKTAPKKKLTPDMLIPYQRPKRRPAPKTLEMPKGISDYAKRPRRIAPKSIKPKTTAFRRQMGR